MPGWFPALSPEEGTASRRRASLGEVAERGPCFDGGRAFFVVSAQGGHVAGTAPPAPQTARIHPFPAPLAPPLAPPLTYLYLSTPQQPHQTPQTMERDDYQTMRHPDDLLTEFQRNVETTASGIHALDILARLHREAPGRWIVVHFVKRTTREERRMIVQVKPELFGGTNYRFPPARRGLLPLYAVEDDVTKMIPLDGVFLVEADGKKYEVRRPSPPPQLDSLDAAQKAAQDLF